MDMHKAKSSPFIRHSKRQAFKNKVTSNESSLRPPHQPKRKPSNTQHSYKRSIKVFKRGDAHFETIDFSMLPTDILEQVRKLDEFSFEKISSLYFVPKEGKLQAALQIMKLAATQQQFTAANLDAKPLEGLVRKPSAMSRNRKPKPKNESNLGKQSQCSEPDRELNAEGIWMDLHQQHKPSKLSPVQDVSVEVSQEAEEQEDLFKDPSPSTRQYQTQNNILIHDNELDDLHSYLFA